MGSLSSKLGALLVKGNLSALKVKLSPDTYGGAPLLGVKGAVIVGHGSSNATAIKNGIAVAAAAVRADVAGVIAATVGRAEKAAPAAVAAEGAAAADGAAPAVGDTAAAAARTPAGGEGEAAASDAR